jgi:hypothetical protein
MDMTRLTAEDCQEMLDIYEYYRSIGHPLNQDDLAFMFNTSKSTVKRVMCGVHPAYIA